MNVKQELMKQDNIKNVVCREDGSLEIYSIGDVKVDVIGFINRKCLIDCFIRIDFYNMENWEK